MSARPSGVWLGITNFVRLLQSQKLTKQDGFVAAWACAAQTEGMHKQPALGAAALAERAFAARRTLVYGVGDQRPSTLQVSAELAKVHARQCLMAESKRALFARVVTVTSTSAGRRSTTRWAAAGGVGLGGTVTRTVTYGLRARRGGRHPSDPGWVVGLNGLSPTRTRFAAVFTPCSP